MVIISSNIEVPFIEHFEVLNFYLGKNIWLPANLTKYNMFFFLESVTKISVLLLNEYVPSIVCG